MAEQENKSEYSYKLRCSLNGHSSDVRCVSVSSDGDIITASRDQTAKLWQQSPDNGRYEEKITYIGHTGYVTSICLVQDLHNEFPDGLTVTGSKDSTILVFPRLCGNPVQTLSGHSDTVSCLVYAKGCLISGSWDHSIRVWKNWECENTLNGHSGPVWSLATLPIGDSDELNLISASADKTLKFWRNNKAITTYTGHTDCVRGVTVLDSERFLSCSNDATLRLWNISGSCLSTFYGHTNFIYSVSLLGVDGFLSGGEDRSVRVWNNDGSNVCTLYIPSQSVWAVGALPNSDIVVGSSDGVCRLFSRDLDRQASSSEISQYEESLASFKVAVEDLGGIKKSDLPDKTVLYTPGKRDGQTIMVKDESGKVLCYSWSASKGEWEAVGEVVGGAGGSASSSGKVLFEGREYDYVFDVDLDEGRFIKLPYNKGEDPWLVAQVFIHRHELPQDYLDVVAKFITKNANVASDSVRSSDYYDPFTGGSRYVPSGNAFQNGTANSSNTQTASITTVNNVSSPYFPQTIPLKFENINKEGMMTKLEEFNCLVEEPLSKEDVHKLVNAVISSNVVVADLVLLEKALKWPSERVWPVLEVLRLALRSEAAQLEWLDETKGTVIVQLLNQLLLTSSCTPTQLLSLRCLANLAAHRPGQKALIHSVNSIITSTLTLAPYSNKNLEIAATTLFINISIILKESKEPEIYCQILSGVATVALIASDAEAQFRVLVALGSLLSNGGNAISSLARSLDIKSIVEKYAVVDEPRKIGECARHLLPLL